MKLYTFASKNLTNIWAGIGAGIWAVAQTSDSNMKSRATKAKAMSVGSAGLLYCNETHSFTTPFLVYSQPDPIAKVSDVWPEAWCLPFKIHALGTPRRQVHKDEAAMTWPICSNLGPGGVSAALNFTGTTIFVGKEIDNSQWAQILEELADVNFGRNN